MARCSGREHPSGLTFAPSTNGRTRRVPNRYCGSRTSISPNFVCQRSFFHLGDASAGVGESPAPSPPPAARPNSSAPPVPEDASPQPSAFPQHRLPSIRPRPLRPPAQSTTPAREASDAPATPQQAHHRSTPRPPSATSRQITQTEPTLHRFESHPRGPRGGPSCCVPPSPAATSNREPRYANPTAHLAAPGQGLTTSARVSPFFGHLFVFSALQSG